MLERITIATLALVGLGSAAAAAAPALAVEFPPYESVRSLDDYATPAEYAAAVADRGFVMERIAYPSDDLQVYAYVYRPTVSDGRLPVIIFNRGSWTWQDFSAELVTMANRIARRGFLVVAPMYRGSGGAAGRDEMGGADLNDLFHLLPVLRALPNADPGRLYLYGESRGGMMVYQALRDGFPARAAAVVGAFTDLEQMLRDPQWAAAGKAIWPELEQSRDEIVQRRSAQRWAERINTPVFILHGANDELVAPTQALDMAAALTTAGKSYRLLIVEDAGHTIAARAEERDRRVADWLARH